MRNAREIAIMLGFVTLGFITTTIVIYGALSLAYSMGWYA